jgi:hypothetical protein
MTMSYQNNFPVKLNYSQAGVPSVCGLPQFWPRQPRAWCTRAEQVFSTYNTNSESHLHHTLASFPIEIFLAVHWALEKAFNSKSPYEVFKTVLISTYGKNESYCTATTPAASTPSSYEDRQPQVRSLTKSNAAAATASAALTREVRQRRRRPTGRITAAAGGKPTSTNRCGLYTILKRGQTAAGKRPCHRTP